MSLSWSAGDIITAGKLNALSEIGRFVFRAERTTAQSISNGSIPALADAISWDLIFLDLVTGWGAGNPTRFNPQLAGRYLLAGGIGYIATASGGLRGGAWARNGSFAQGSTGVGGPGTTKIVTNTTVTSIDASVAMRPIEVSMNGTTDYVELAGLQVSGAALNTATLTVRPHISAFYVGPL